MSFATTLDGYCKTLDCTGKAIAERSGLSPSTLSRYLNGERTPEAGSENVRKLANGLAQLSRERDEFEPLDADEVNATLEAEIAGTRMVGMDFHMRLDTLMHLVGMRNADFAKLVGVDPSYISRIRRGQRMPADLPRLATNCAHLAAHLCIERELLAELGELVGVSDITSGHPEWDPHDESNIAEIIEVWLKGSQIVQADMAKLDDLLTWLDETDLGTWLSIADESLEATTPPSPFARFYYGVGGMRSAEIDFLKTAADTHARNLSLSSDTPFTLIPPDSRFIRQYERTLMRVLKTGCRINVFYSVERPLEDTIRSMRLWIPLYMTGQITPYYLKGVNNRLFFHMNYVCDTCALSSEAVMGHEEDGRYYFTSRPEDVAYYQRKMGFILEKASSLLEIYRECDPGQKQAFENGEAARQAKGRGRDLGQDRFRNLRVTIYPGDCTVLTLPCGPTVVHFVIRHPKINYLIARM